MNERVVDDPLLRLIEWHSSGRTEDNELPDARLSLRDDHAIDAALFEWHMQRTETRDAR